MSDEKWLREGLADAVPTPPTMPDRPAAAVARARRARRRTTILGAGAVVATVAAVATLATTLTGPGDEPSPAQDGTDRGRPSSPYDVAACPPGPREGEEDPLDLPADSGPDAVPEGAVSVRLCQGAGTPIDAPDDALISGVDTVVALVNRLEKTGKPEVCTMDLGPGYRLVFGYDDGSTFVVSGRLYGCRELVVGSGYRADSQALWGRFIDLLREQRADLDPPAQPDISAVDCELQPATSPVARPQDLVMAILCIGPRRAEISAEELALLVEDMKAHSEPGVIVPDCGAAPPFPSIEGIGAWGDRITLRSECGIGFFPIFDASGTTLGSTWVAGDDARRVIQRLIDRAS